MGDQVALDSSMQVNRADVADIYHRSRPGYPAALVDRLVARIGLTSGDAVAEIGARTGRFTSLLAERGFCVTALEPNSEMQRLGHAGISRPRACPRARNVGSWLPNLSGMSIPRARFRKSGACFLLVAG